MLICVVEVSFLPAVTLAPATISRLVGRSHHLGSQTCEDSPDLAVRLCHRMPVHLSRPCHRQGRRGVGALVEFLTRFH